MAHLKTLRDRAQTSIQRAQAMTKKYMERKKGQCNFRPFAEGQLVWLEGTNLRLSHPNTKLRPKRFGPFRITHVISPCVYCLDLPIQWKIHNVFHASLLSPYNKTPEHGPNYPEPPLELIDDQPEYKVEQVLGSCQVGCYRKLQYLLRWKGYSAAHDSWEAAAETNCPDLVQEFYVANPAAIRGAQETYMNPSEINYDNIPSSPINPHNYTMETRSSPDYQSQDSTETGLALRQSTLDNQSTELAYYNQQENEENQWINCNNDNKEEFYNEDH